MIKESQIKGMTADATFQKAKTLYAAGNILELQIDQSEYFALDGNYEYIDAEVKGSGRKSYSVEITVDQSKDTIEDIYCDCPAFENYTGICKHCASVLLAYVDWKSGKSVVLESGEDSQKSGMTLPKRGTTSQIKQLLIQQNSRKVLPLLQKEKYGQIQIEPHLVIRDNEIVADFKIGNNSKKMYVLKDICEFQEHMDNNAMYSYGKNLEFIHMEEAFTEESKPLVRFLVKWSKAEHKEYQIYRSYYYGGYQAKTRNINLTDEDLEDFLMATKNMNISVSEPRKQDKTYRVTDEILERKMQIKGLEDGIEFKLAVMKGFVTANYLVYFLNNKIFMQSRESIRDIEDFIFEMGKIKDRTAFIAAEDVPAFCRDLLPLLEKHYKIKTTNFTPQDFGTLEPEFKFYLDMPQDELIQIQCKAFYDEKEYSIFQRNDLTENRDFVKEAEIASYVSYFSNAFDEKKCCMVIYQSEEKIYDLFIEGIPKFQTLGEVFVSDALKRLEVRSAPKVSVGVSLSGNLLELTMTSGDMSREELIEILSKYDRKKKFYRLKTGEFVQMEGQDLDVLLEVKQALQLTDKQMMKEEIQIPKFRALYLDAELKEHQGIAVTKNKDFRSLIRNMKTVEDNDFEIPENLEKTLREYQKRGYLWIKTLKANGFGGILADDMGLGKTLQVITFLLSEYQEKQNMETLIVTPASLVFNWKQELERFAPELPVRLITGIAAERKEQIEKAKQEMKEGRYEILVTSYDLLKRDITSYEDFAFANEMIDEAQFIKNQGTMAAKAVKQIQADFKLALTGTPVENKLSELWSIFDYLMPGFLFSYQKFKEELELPITQNNDTHAMTRIQRMIRPFVLRRLKKDVLTDLPDKLEENYYAKLEGEQQKLYDAHVKRMKLLLDKQSDEEFRQSKIQVLSELTRLRQICCDPSLVFENYNDNSAKLELCINLLGNAVSAGHKILLFSQFTTMMDHIAARLEEEGISYYTLTGATSKEKRAKLVKDFNEDDTSVFCISLKAGGTGLNLTAADMVIHYDPWWNVAVQNQATDRAHRIGQKNVVNVYKLIVKGTIEENIVKLQEKKQELADQILGGEGVGAGSFTRDELLEILGE